MFSLMKLRNMAINRLRSGQRKHNAVGRFKRTMSVERLEDRSLLACDAFQFGESVLILGDRNDNVIETVDNGDRSLDVVCSSNQLLRDGHFAFDNVGRIFVLPRAGNDTLMHTLSPQAQSTVSNPIDVFARLGTGDDILRVLVENARLAGPFEVLGGGGAGNDALSMEVRNSTVDDVMTTEFNGWRGQDNLEAIYSGVRFEAPHSIKLNGAQDDDYQRLIYERVAFGPDATFETDVQGGNGNNTLLSLFDDVDVDGQAQGWQWAGAGDRPHVSGMDSSNTIVALHNNFHSASPIVAHYEGGKGDDLFLSAFTNSNVAADHDMVINARRGNDLAMLFESNVTRGGGPQAAGIENHVELNMGKGNDDVTILQGCPTSLADAFELFPGDSVVAGSVARIQQTLDRLGLDLFSGSSPSQLCPSSSVPDQGQLKVNVLTGDGEDNVVVGVTNIFWGRSINRLSADLGRRDDTLSIVDRGGLYKNIDVKGRKGKDDIRLDYQIDPRNESDIIARVDGGRDDDTLAWTVVGDDSAFELSAELNGGAGIDHCTATPQVTVTNCEEQPTLNEPPTLTLDEDGSSGAPEGNYATNFAFPIGGFGSGPVALADQDIGIFSNDHDDRYPFITSATITLIDPFDEQFESLTPGATLPAGISLRADSTRHKLIFEGLASADDYEKAIREAVYDNTAPVPGATPGLRTVTVVLEDIDGLLSNTATTTIDVILFLI